MSLSLHAVGSNSQISMNYLDLGLVGPLADQSNAGTSITLNTGFHAGTHIATPRGDILVEQLANGDLIYTRDSIPAAIKWIGHRRVDCRRHSMPQSVWPVRVVPHAFEEGHPCVDLYLSPDHAVLSDGVLIPIKHLINGATIVQEPCDDVIYWHVELDQHEAILAAGLPCESYLDTGNRSSFSNGGEVVNSPKVASGEGAEAIWEAAGCAPLRIEGEAFARVEARLARRAVKLGQSGKPVRKKARRVANRIAAAIDLASLLEPAWYLATNSDVAAAGVDAWTHYVGAGRREGRRPCPEVDLVRAVGLIDPVTVAIVMPDVIAAGVDPVEHFCAVGWIERRSPNPYFNTGWYLDTHDVPDGMNPLLHYVLLGENSGLAPSRHFDPAWYRQRYEIPPSVSALAHYLQYRRIHQLSPIPSFDLPAYTEAKKATLRPNRDPYLHFLAFVERD